MCFSCADQEKREERTRKPALILETERVSMAFFYHGIVSAWGARWSRSRRPVIDVPIIDEWRKYAIGDKKSSVCGCGNSAICYFMMARERAVVIYLFPYLSAHLVECFYRHGVHGIPVGVAATSFPLCKTKMATALSLSLLSTQFSRNTMKTPFVLVFLLIRCQSYHSARRVDARDVRASPIKRQ